MSLKFILMKLIPQIRLFWERAYGFLGEWRALHESAMVISNVPGVGYRNPLTVPESGEN